MSARAHGTYQHHETLDDDQQQALLDQARLGSETAYGDLLECQREWLIYSFQERLPRSMQSKLDADDLVQEVVFRAWRARQSCQGESLPVFRGWLVKIGDNSLADEVDHFVIARCRTAKREVRFDERAFERGEQRRCQREDIVGDDVRMLVEVEVFEKWLAALPSNGGGCSFGTSATAAASPTSPRSSAAARAPCNALAWRCALHWTAVWPTNQAKHPQMAPATVITARLPAAISKFSRGRSRSQCPRSGVRSQ